MMIYGTGTEKLGQTGEIRIVTVILVDMCR